MPLAYKEVTLRKVDYQDVDDLIAEVYGREYEIVPSEEWNNMQDHEVTVEKGEIDEYDQKKLNRFKNGDGIPSYMLYALLTDMCNNGHIEPGEYLISVDW
jgi:hypothetical protein